MEANAEYTGTHKVVLPSDFMNSIEAVCDLHEERINEVGTSLDIPGLRLTWSQRLFRLTLVGLMIWLIPLVLPLFE